jgi:hypothetical protein
VQQDERFQQTQNSFILRTGLQLADVSIVVKAFSDAQTLRLKSNGCTPPRHSLRPKTLNLSHFFCQQACLHVTNERINSAPEHRQQHRILAFLC